MVFIPKWERFRDRKPTGPVEINWGHPLTNGLIAASTNLDVDAVSGALLSGSAPARYDPYGQSKYCGTDYVAYQPQITPSFLAGAKELTIISGIMRKTALSTYEQVIASDWISTGAASSVLVRMHPTSGIQFLTYGNFVPFVNTLSYNNNPAINEYSIITARYDNGTKQIFKDSAQSTTTTHGTLLNSSATESVKLGYSAHDSNEVLSGNIYFNYIFTKALRNEEIFSLHEAPYQILKPRVKYFDLGAASGGQTVNVGLLANASTVYSPTIIPGAVAVEVGLLTNASTLYSPSVSAEAPAQTVSPGLLDNQSTLYSPALEPGAVSVSVGLLNNASIVYSPTVSTGPAPQTVSPGLLENAATLYSPALVPGAVAVSVGLLTNASVIYSPNIFTGFAPQTVNVGLLQNDSALYSPAIEPGAVSVSVGLLSNQSVLYSPTVNVQGAPQIVSVDLLNNQSTLFSPTIEPGPVAVSVGLLANANVLYSPSVSAGIAPQTISVGLLNNQSALYSPALVPGGVTVSVAMLTNAATLYSPVVSVELGGDLRITGDTVFVTRNDVPVVVMRNDVPVQVLR